MEPPPPGYGLAIYINLPCMYMEATIVVYESRGVYMIRVGGGGGAQDEKKIGRGEPQI